MLYYHNNQVRDHIVMLYYHNNQVRDHIVMLYYHNNQVRDHIVMLYYLKGFHPVFENICDSCIGTKNKLFDCS